MSTYKVSHEIFPSANKQLKEVRLIKSNKTGKFYISCVEGGLLLNVKSEYLSGKTQLLYRWSVKEDGPALSSLFMSDVLLQNYISVDTFCARFLNNYELMCNEFAQWRSASSADEQEVEAVAPRKRGRPAKTIIPLRKRVSASPAPQASAANIAYEQVVRDWFAKNEPQLREQAIERLMQKQEVRDAAIDRAAKLLAQLAQPSAKEIIDKIFQ